MSAPSQPQVTREDAIRFCETAMRNWEHVNFDEDGLEDLRATLERQRTAVEAASAARVAELVGLLLEARSGLVAFAEDGCSQTIEKIDRTLAKHRSQSDAGGEG